MSLSIKRQSNLFLKIRKLFEILYNKFPLYLTTVLYTYVQYADLMIKKRCTCPQICLYRFNGLLAHR